MTTEELDILWARALRDSVAAGEMYTRYRFAALVAAAEREKCATYTHPPFRKCEFCGCNTNARVRACCDKGRAADGSTKGLTP